MIGQSQGIDESFDAEKYSDTYKIHILDECDDLNSKTLLAKNSDTLNGFSKTLKLICDILMCKTSKKNVHNTKNSSCLLIKATALEVLNTLLQNYKGNVNEKQSFDILMYVHDILSELWKHEECESGQFSKANSWAKYPGNVMYIEFLAYTFLLIKETLENCMFIPLELAKHTAENESKYLYEMDSISQIDYILQQSTRSDFTNCHSGKC